MMAPNRRYELSTEFRTPSQDNKLGLRSRGYQQDSWRGFYRTERFRRGDRAFLRSEPIRRPPDPQRSTRLTSASRRKETTRRWRSASTLRYRVTWFSSPRLTRPGSQFKRKDRGGGRGGRCCRGSRKGWCHSTPSAWLISTHSLPEKPHVAECRPLSLLVACFPLPEPPRYGCLTKFKLKQGASGKH